MIRFETLQAAWGAAYWHKQGQTGRVIAGLNLSIVRMAQVLARYKGCKS